MLSYEIFRLAGKALEPTLNYLSDHGMIHKLRYKWENLFKLLYHGIIYSNCLVQECLNEINRESPAQSIQLFGSEDASSDDAYHEKFNLIYHKREFQEYLKVTEADKSQF